MNNLFIPFDNLVHKHPLLLTFKMIWSYLYLRKEFFWGFLMILFTGLFIPLLFLLFIPLLVVTLIELSILGKELLETKTFYNFLRTIKKNNIYDKVLEDSFFISSLGLLFGWGTLFITATILFILFFVTLGKLQETFLIEQVFQLVNYHYSLYLIPLALLIFIYLQPLVLSKFLKTTHFWDGYLSTFYIFSIFVWRDALKIKYIRYLLALSLISTIGISSLLYFIISTISFFLLFSTSTLLYLLIIFIVCIAYYILVFILMTTLVANRLVQNK